jgi:glycosyltransferase involved in cell wall biosynthesis
MSTRPPLLLSSAHASLARRSGYQVIADYLPGAQLITAIREDPASALLLLGARLLRRGAFSRWYLGGSAQLEWKAWQTLRTAGPSPVHMLWSDLDLGYLDLLLDRDRHPLFGTFHQCSDALNSTIRFPHRLRKFAGVILMSATQRPYFEQNGVDPARIHVVLHGVDSAHFTPAATRNAEPIRVLAVGGYRRNFSLLQSICAHFTGGTIEWDIVAPSSVAPMFAGMPHVKFQSGVSDESLLELYRSASIFLHLAENATANNALLEAMSCGTPVVAERVGGVPEYATTDAAILVPPGERDALIRAIEDLANARVRRTEMGMAARSRAQELDWKNIAQETEAVYATAG